MKEPQARECRQHLEGGKGRETDSPLKSPKGTWLCQCLDCWPIFWFLTSSKKSKKVDKTTRPFRYDLNQIPYDYTVEVRNKFKGLDLIDRVPDELWMEVRNIVQETGIKIITKKKKCKKAKWLSEEALQIAVKRREAKSKGEKENYTYLKAEFQRIARRDKKAFLSDQCKEIEENNRMGKTRDRFKKIRIPRELFTQKWSQ